VRALLEMRGMLDNLDMTVGVTGQQRPRVEEHPADMPAAKHVMIDTTIKDDTIVADVKPTGGGGAFTAADAVDAFVDGLIGKALQQPVRAPVPEGPEEQDGDADLSELLRNLMLAGSAVSARAVAGGGGGGEKLGELLGGLLDKWRAHTPSK